MSTANSLKSMLKTRFVGTLLGGAVGDALGFPYEGSSRSFLFALGDEVTEEFTADKTGYFAAGQYSDETQLALIVAESLIDRGTFDVEAVAEALAELWRDNRVIGRDPQTHAAVERLVAGATWETSGCDEEAWGNGALSRAVVLGLWYHDRLDLLTPATVACTQVTHRGDVPAGCAVAVASAISYCVTHREIVLGEFIDTIVAATSDVCREVADLVKNITHTVARPEPAVLHELTDLGHDDTRIPEGISSDARSTLLVALYYFLRAPSDIEGALRGCLLAGGDVDSTAFLAGALGGAFNGAEDVPSGLRDSLVEADRISRLGADLYVARSNTRG